MTKQQLFASIEILLEYLTEHRKSGTLRFKDAEEKLSIKAIYKEIYPQVTPDLNCITCILGYINQLQAFYEREYPKYLLTLDDSTLNPSAEDVKTKEIIVEKAAIIPPVSQPTKKNRNRKK